MNNIVRIVCRRLLWHPLNAQWRCVADWLCVVACFRQFTTSVHVRSLKERFLHANAKALACSCNPTTVTPLSPPPEAPHMQRMRKESIVQLSRLQNDNKRHWFTLYTERSFDGMHLKTLSVGTVHWDRAVVREARQCCFERASTTKKYVFKTWLFLE